MAPSVEKAFVVGHGYAPIPGKLVAKITSGAFVKLADLLAENIRVQEAEPHTYLDGKLLVAPAKNRDGRDKRYSHMNSGLYHLPVDLPRPLSELPPTSVSSLGH